MELRSSDAMLTKTLIKLSHAIHFGRKIVAHTDSGAISPTLSHPAMRTLNQWSPSNQTSSNIGI